MAAPRATKILLENGTSTLASGAEPQQIYALMGRNTKDVITNKVITDPSNKVAATYLSVAGVPVYLEADGVAGTVLTRTATGASFLPGGGGGGGAYDVVVIPFTGLSGAGANQYVSFGAPADIIGTSAADITIQAAAPSGSQFVSSKPIYSVDCQIGLQYISQGTNRRTFCNVIVDGVTQPSPGADTVAAGVNNFRQTFSYSVYGVPAALATRVTLNTNVSGPVTLNTGRLYLILQP